MLHGLAPDALATYDARHVTVRATGTEHENVVLLRGGREAISEQAFRESYRKVTGSGDLDADARRRAVRKNPLALGMGIGALVVGAGGLTAVALAQPDICHDSQGKELPGCGKAALGLGVLALIAGVGVYTVGCEVVKGADCIVDGNFGVGGAGLRADAAEYYVARYNAALASSLRDGAAPTAPTEGPFERPVDHEEKRPTAAVRITPFGVVGRF
jgi:hypothetical protein